MLQEYTCKIFTLLPSWLFQPPPASLLEVLDWDWRIWRIVNTTSNFLIYFLTSFEIDFVMNDFVIDFVMNDFEIDFEIDLLMHVDLLHQFDVV